MEMEYKTVTLPWVMPCIFEAQHRAEWAQEVSSKITAGVGQLIAVKG